MKQKKNSEVGFIDLLERNKININYMFLGAGLVMFLTNISTFIIFVRGVYPFISFNITIFSSIIVILFSVYNIYNPE